MSNSLLLKAAMIPMILAIAAVINISGCSAESVFRSNQQTPETTPVMEGFASTPPNQTHPPNTEPSPESAKPPDPLPLPDPAPSPKPAPSPSPASSPSGQNDRAELSEELAVAAFREFLDTPQEFRSSAVSRNVSWSIQDVRYAELIDFDYDGIPEMVMLVHDAAFISGFDDNQRYWIWVVGLDSLGRADILYYHSVGYNGPADLWHEIAYGPGGKVFLINNLSSNFDSSSEILVLENGVFLPVIDFAWAYDSFWFDDEEDKFSVGRDSVSAEELDQALTELRGRIVHIQQLSQYTTNDVQLFVASLN